MTITEFLLARIDEDEAVARSITLDPDGVARQRFGKPGVIQWAALTVDRPWRGGVERVLAECEAKRQIIGDPDHRGGVMYDHFMMCLATVYAGHPDFQEEWRPTR